MKRLTLAIAMAALVLFAGCKKETETTGTTIKASIEQCKGDGSKTSIVPMGDEAEIRWTAGDKIVVNNGTSPSTVFTLTDGQGNKKGTFTYNGEYTFGDNSTAVYPETATFDGSEVTITLPAKLNYDVNKNGANPMLGKISNPDNFTMKSLCGVLGISLTGADINITAIEVVSKNVADKLNGTFTVDANATGTDLKLVKSGTDGTNSVRLNCTTTLTSVAKNFYFALPVGTLVDGFTLKVHIDGEAVPFVQATDNDIHIVLNQVNMMPEVAVSVTVENIVNLNELTGDYVAQNGDVLTGDLLGNDETRTYKISIADGATVKLRDAVINPSVFDFPSWVFGYHLWAGITCLGDAEIILEGTNFVRAFSVEEPPHNTGYPGIQVGPVGTTLTISGNGSLTATSYWMAYEEQYCSGAGIGARDYARCGNIIINSGTVTAIGGSAGIGSADGSYDYGESSCGDITINGGTVTATGVSSGAGIGSANAGMDGPGGIGTKSSCGNITINGGTVIANGGNFGSAGIGTGYGNGGRSSCGDITITGGNVTANGGNNNFSGDSGSGIGTCYTQTDMGVNSCGNINITGGTVTATGGLRAAGIGTGYRWSGTNICGDITITNGVTQVTATKGSDALYSIGEGNDTGSTDGGYVSIGTITIGGTVTGPISDSPYTYHP